MSNNYIKQLDPMRGLVEYINDVKPYHTKIIENEVEYVNTEQLNGSMTETIVMEIVTTTIVLPGAPELTAEYVPGEPAEPELPGAPVLTAEYFPGGE